MFTISISIFSTILLTIGFISLIFLFFLKKDYVNKLFIPKSIRKLIDNFDEGSKKNYDEAWLEWVKFSKNNRQDLVNLIRAPDEGKNRVNPEIKRRAIFTLLSPFEEWCPLSWWKSEDYKYDDHYEDTFLKRNIFLEKINIRFITYIIKVINIFMKELRLDPRIEFHKQKEFSNYYDIIFTLLKHYSEKVKRESLNLFFNYLRYEIIGSGNIVIKFFNDEKITDKQKSEMQNKLEIFIEETNDSEMQKRILNYYKISIFYFLKNNNEFYDSAKLAEAVKFLLKFKSNLIQAWKYLEILDLFPQEEYPEFYKEAIEKLCTLEEERLETLGDKALEALQKLVVKLLAGNFSTEKRLPLQEISSLIDQSLQKRNEENRKAKEKSVTIANNIKKAGQIRKKQEEKAQAEKVKREKKERKSLIANHDRDLIKRREKLKKEKEKVYSALQ